MTDDWSDDKALRESYPGTNPNAPTCATWQPIETAPTKADVEFLAYGIAVGEVYGEGDSPVIRVVQRWNDGAQLFESGGEYYSVEIQATHWMPLPPAPTDDGA